MPANRNAANANIVRLNAVVEEIEGLKAELAAYKDKNSRALRILSKQHEVLMYEKEELRERVEYVEALLGVDDVEKAGGDPVSAEGAAGVSATEMQAAQPIKVARGPKGAISNPKNSEEAKQHPQDHLDDLNARGEVDSSEEHAGQVERGHKAAMSNHKTSEDAKQPSQQVIDDFSS